MNKLTARGLLAFVSLLSAAALPAACFSDYSNDCTRNPELDCFWGGGGGGGTTSAAPRCGDGNVDPGEVCDDGNNVDCDTCQGDCKAKVTGCGDGVVCGAEKCDDGSNNSDTGACTTKCQLPGCGDGTVQGTEECDDGNTASGDGCSSKCKNECTGGGLTNPAVFLDPDTLHCYARVDGKKVSWQGAQNLCKDWSPTADLVGFGSVDEIHLVGKALPGAAKAWTGGNDQMTAGDYVWSDGEPFPPPSMGIWAPNEPSDGAGNAEKCISIDAAYLLNDDGCSNFFGFVCELDLATLK